MAAICELFLKLIPCSRQGNLLDHPGQGLTSLNRKCTVKNLLKSWSRVIYEHKPTPYDRCCSSGQKLVKLNVVKKLMVYSILVSKNEFRSCITFKETRFLKNVDKLNIFHQPT